MPSKTICLKLAHINDTHSHFDPVLTDLLLPIGEGKILVKILAGGYSRIATFIKEERKSAKEKGLEFLFLHAGDSFQGTLYFSCFKGQANAELLNMLDIDAMVIGNHELDMGNKPLNDFIKKTTFPILAANLFFSQDSSGKEPLMQGLPNLFSYNNTGNFRKYIIRTVDEERLAIIGLTLDNMLTIAAPDPGTLFLDAKETARSLIQEIHRLGINKIIVLSHLGYENDRVLAQEVEGISIIVGGHTHILQGDFRNLGWKKEVPYGERINNTYIFQSGCNALTIGTADLVFDELGYVQILSGGNQLLVEDYTKLKIINGNSDCLSISNGLKDYLQNQTNVRIVEPDPDFESVLNKNYRPLIKQYETNVIANLQAPLRHIRVPDNHGGSQVAPIIAESLLYHSRKIGEKTDFAIFNAGGARVSLSSGPLTEAEIIGRLLPFTIPAYTYYILGDSVRKALEGAIENALDNTMNGTGSFPYTADLRFNLFINRKAGQRIQDLEYKNIDGIWEQVENDKLFCVVTTSYTALGKEGYTALLDRIGETKSSEISIADIFIDYIREKSVVEQLRSELIVTKTDN